MGVSCYRQGRNAKTAGAVSHAPQRQMRAYEKKVFCRYDHDTRVLGRTKSGNCRACARSEREVQKKKQYRKEHRSMCLNASKRHWWRVQGILNRNGSVFTPEDYSKMFDEQGGRCWICKKPQTELRRALNADHCHTTGRIRGLLCNNCNQHLGMYERMKSLGAEEYLRSTSP